jgi:hypothetical protein
MEVAQEQYDEQVRLAWQIRERADAEATILDQVIEERKRTISTLVGDAWKTRTFGDSYKTHIDPLLSKKFRTKAGLSSVRLEKLLLELDKMESYGNEELRALRKDNVKYIQSLLQRADQMNEKANKLVGFQDRLAEIGKHTIRTSLETIKLKQQQGEDEQRALRKRRFASGDAQVDEVSGKTSDDAQPEEGPTMDVETPSPPLTEHMLVNAKDSVEDLKQVQEKTDRKAEASYKAAHQQSAAHQRKDATETMREYNKLKAQPSPVALTEPKVSVEELPRAFVMMVNDINARRAKVSLVGEDVLTIAIPGRAPVKFQLSQNINTGGITKEAQGDLLRLVLPKLSAFPMRTGRTHNEFATPWSGRGRRGRDNFWSRF